VATRCEPGRPRGPMLKTRLSNRPLRSDPPGGIEGFTTRQSLGRCLVPSTVRTDFFGVAIITVESGPAKRRLRFAMNTWFANRRRLVLQALILHEKAAPQPSREPAVTLNGDPPPRL